MASSGSNLASSSTGINTTETVFFKQPVISSRFKDLSPLTKFDICLNLIKGLLKLLMVFVDQPSWSCCFAASRSPSDDFANIMASLMSKKDFFDKQGGLLVMENLKWIQLDESGLNILTEMKFDISKARTRNPLPIQSRQEYKVSSDNGIKDAIICQFFCFDLVTRFVNDHVNSRHKIASAAVPNQTIIDDLVEAVYKIIEFNALPYDIRQYGETHFKEIVSAADVQMNQVKGNLKTAMRTLILNIKTTNQVDAITVAQDLLNTYSDKTRESYLACLNRPNPPEEKPILLIPPTSPAMDKFRLFNDASNNIHTLTATTKEDNSSAEDAESLGLEVYLSLIHDSLLQYLGKNKSANDEPNVVLLSTKYVATRETQSATTNSLQIDEQLQDLKQFIKQFTANNPTDGSLEKILDDNLQIELNKHTLLRVLLH